MKSKRIQHDSLNKEGNQGAFIEYKDTDETREELVLRL